jgi:hypothetical protein
MMVYEIIILYDVKISKFDYDALNTMKRLFFKKQYCMIFSLLIRVLDHKPMMINNYTLCWWKILIEEKIASFLIFVTLLVASTKDFILSNNLSES